jgi:hypothetical protein
MNPLALLSFLGTPAGRFAATVAGGTVALAVTFGTGFYKGDVHRAALDNAAGALAKAEFLQRQLTALDTAAKQDAMQAKADLERLSAELEKAKNAQANVTAGDCLSGPDADQLRSLWTVPHNGKHPDPAPKPAK